MRITRHVYLVGSGHFGLSHAFDSSVYVVSCDDQLVMIDTGAGCEPEKIVENIEKENLEIEKLKTVLLTHSHADHSGGAHFFSENFGCDVFVSYCSVWQTRFQSDSCSRTQPGLIVLLD